MTEILSANKVKRCEFDCEKQSDATAECSICDAAFCNDCFASTHANGPLKNHARLGVGGRKKVMLCKKHDKKEIEIHCKICIEDICSLRD